MRLLLLLSIGAVPLQLSGQRAESLPSMSRRSQELVEKVNPAVVQIITRGFAPASDGDGPPIVRTHRGSGSGVIVDPSGYILTNAHVVGAVRRVQVLVPQPAERSHSGSVLKPGGKLIPAQVVGTDRETDIAVLKIDGQQLPSLPFGNSEEIRQGSIVFAFGSPFGLENSVTMGVVSSVARQLRPEDPMIYIQTDASINPGNSGGPLVDTEGQIIGINTFILSKSGGNQGVGFAAPSNIVRSIYEQIRRTGRVKRGQIGVVAQTITPALMQALGLDQDWGVLVADVVPGSAAESAGLEIRDVVLRFNGKVMENARQLGVNIYQSAGEVVALEVLRGKTRKTLKVAVLERPRDPGQIYSLATGEENMIPRLGILAVDLDEKVTPLLPPLRKLSGVVVAGVLVDVSSQEDPFLAGDVIYAVNNTAVRSLQDLKAAVNGIMAGEVVAVQVERAGQLQFLLMEIE
jgi:serine protease Do